MTSLFTKVRNAQSEWNNNSDPFLLNPLEVRYLITMVKSSDRALEEADMLRPYFKRARQTLQALLAETQEHKQVQVVLE